MKPKFTQKSIRRHIDRAIEGFENVLIDTFSQVGAQFVRDARLTQTYKDQTGNLRHSIGFTVLKDGVSIFENFENDGVGTGKARELINNLSDDFRKGYALIVVAGMNYAAYVEAKGYDVITGSSLQAETELKRILNKIKKKK